jgi:hypothetical protein
MGNFSISEMNSIDIISEIRRCNPSRLLISDGIILEKIILDYDLKIQRIMTSYQLNKIIMDGNIESYLILISSTVFDAWSLIAIEELNYIMGIAAYNGSTIMLDIVGAKTVNAEFMVR